MSPIFRATIAVVLTCPMARAELHCERPDVDAGTVHCGVPLRHTYAVVNHGPETITILDVRSSCGCLRPRLAKRTLAPGETAELPLEVLTLSQPAGPNRWRLLVRYSETGQIRELPLSLRANLRVQVRVEPAQLALSITGPLSHTFTLTDSRPRPLKITHAQTGHPHLLASFEPTVNPGTWKIRLAVSPELPEGRYEVSLRIITDDPDYQVIAVPLTVTRRSPRKVSASPAALNLSVASGQGVVRRTILLRSGDDRPVEVEKIDCDHPALRASWEKGPGNLVRLTVLIDPSQGQPIQGTIQVQIAAPGGCRVTIPVDVALR